MIGTKALNIHVERPVQDISDLENQNGKISPNMEDEATGQVSFNPKIIVNPNCEQGGQCFLRPVLSNGPHVIAEHLKCGRSKMCRKCKIT